MSRRTSLVQPSCVIGENYVVQGLLGRAPWATTYAAFTVPNRHVAVKVLDPTLLSLPGVLEELELALVPVMQLADPVALRPLDAGEDDENGVFVVTPLCHSPSLAELVAVSPLGIHEVAELLTHVGRATASVPHLGLKASNVFVGPPPNQDVLLADFALDGLRRAHMRASDSPERTWLAPEQGVDPVDEPARADVYAAGLVACFALTGSPLEGNSPREHAARHRVDLGPAVDEVLRRALAPLPARRFATVSELAQALRASIDKQASGSIVAATTRHARATGQIRRFRLPENVADTRERSGASMPAKAEAEADGFDHLWATLPPPPSPGAEAPNPSGQVDRAVPPSPPTTRPPPNGTARMAPFKLPARHRPSGAPTAPPPPNRPPAPRGVPRFADAGPGSSAERRIDKTQMLGAFVMPPDHQVAKTQALSPFEMPRVPSIEGPRAPEPGNAFETTRRRRFSVGNLTRIVEFVRRHPLVLIAASAIVAFLSLVVAIASLLRR